MSNKQFEAVLSVFKNTFDKITKQQNHQGYHCSEYISSILQQNPACEELMKLCGIAIDNNCLKLTDYSNSYLADHILNAYMLQRPRDRRGTVYASSKSVFCDGGVAHPFVLFHEEVSIAIENGNVKFYLNEKEGNRESSHQGNPQANSTHTHSDASELPMLPSKMDDSLVFKPQQKDDTLKPADDKILVEQLAAAGNINNVDDHTKECLLLSSHNNVRENSKSVATSSNYDALPTFVISKDSVLSQHLPRHLANKVGKILARKPVNRPLQQSSTNEKATIVEDSNTEEDTQLCDQDVKDIIVAWETNLSPQLNPDDFQATLTVLNDIYTNATTEKQYHEIKLAEKLFSKKVWCYPACKELMQLTGWIVEDDHIKLRNASHIHIMSEMLQPLCTKHQSTCDYVFVEPICNASLRVPNDTWCKRKEVSLYLVLPKNQVNHLFDALFHGNNLMLCSILDEYDTSLVKDMILPAWQAPLFAPVFTARQIELAHLLTSKYKLDANVLDQYSNPCFHWLFVT